MTTLPRYDSQKSYEWNYEHAPRLSAQAVAELVESTGLPDTRSTSLSIDGQPQDWRFCGLPVPSPLGMPAGPLLNGNWLLYYSLLGFDVLTYKTVRSRERECYRPPNLLPISEALIPSPMTAHACQEMLGSWAVSFGMPSKTPEIWTSDVARTRELLASEKVLCVSVVASAEPHWSLRAVAEDYASCAQLAVAHGADCVELNLSCPNVSSVDGSLYQTPDDARVVIEETRQRLPDTPLLIKIGSLSSADTADGLIVAADANRTAIAMTNCIACHVLDNDEELFDGAPRGIGGSAIRDASISQVQKFNERIDALNCSVDLVGVGGIGSAQDVRGYLHAGAHSVQIATAAMLDPLTAIRIRSSWSA